MKLHTKIGLIFFSAILISCSDDEESTMMTTPSEDVLPEKVTTYEADVKPIIDSKCMICHTEPAQGGARFAMRNYEETKNAVLTKDFLLRIQSTGDNVMPPTGKLPDDMIKTLIDWDADGLKEK